MGIETFADKYDILKQECLKLKQMNIKSLDKISFYKEKSMRLDDTVVVNDSKMERLRNQTVNLEDQIGEMQVQVQEYQEKYRLKKKKIQSLINMM